MGIKTGTKLASYVIDSQDTDPSKITNDALLPYGDSNPLSRVFTVSTTPVRIMAFGLLSGHIEVTRVLLPDGATSLDNCGGINAVDIPFEKAYRVGCRTVVLCPDQDEIVIDAVGAYRIQYFGDEREDVHVVRKLEPVTTITSDLRGTEDCCNV